MTSVNGRFVLRMPCFFPCWVGAERIFLWGEGADHAPPAVQSPWWSVSARCIQYLMVPLGFESTSLQTFLSPPSGRPGRRSRDVTAEDPLVLRRGQIPCETLGNVIEKESMARKRAEMLATRANNSGESAWKHQVRHLAKVMQPSHEISDGFRCSASNAMTHWFPKHWKDPHVNQSMFDVPRGVWNKTLLLACVMSCRWTRTAESTKPGSSGPPAFWDQTAPTWRNAGSKTSNTHDSTRNDLEKKKLAPKTDAERAQLLLDGVGWPNWQRQLYWLCHRRCTQSTNLCQCHGWLLKCELFWILRLIVWEMGFSVDPPLRLESSQGFKGSSTKGQDCKGENDWKIDEAGERELVLVVGVRCGKEWDMTRGWQTVLERPMRAIPSCALLSHTCSREKNVIMLCSVCADTLCASVHAVWLGVLFTAPVDCREVRQSPFVRPWRMPRIPTSRRPIVAFPICWRGRRRQVSLRLFIEPPACSRIEWKVILLNSFEHLRFSLSYLLTARNGSVVFLGPCQVLVMQSFAFSFRLSKSRSLIQWLLSTVLIQFEDPMFRILISDRSCCDVWMITQSHFVMFKNLLLSPPNILQRLSIFGVTVPSFKYGFVSSMLGLTSFLQHFLSLVAHSLSFRRSMFGTATVIFW